MFSTLSKKNGDNQNQSSGNNLSFALVSNNELLNSTRQGTSSLRNRNWTQSFSDQTPIGTFSLRDIVQPEVRIQGFETESSRLATFQNWPVERIVQASAVAHSGMIATGNFDRAKCVFCLGSMYNWEEGDDPLQEHVKHFTKCAYLGYLVKLALYTNVDIILELPDSTLTVSFVSENWLDLDTVKIVRRLGYTEELILKAKVTFLSKQDKPVMKKHFSSELLDILVGLEKVIEEEEKLEKQQRFASAYGVNPKELVTETGNRSQTPLLHPSLPLHQGNSDRLVTLSPTERSVVSNIPQNTNNLYEHISVTHLPTSDVPTNRNRSQHAIEAMARELTISVERSVNNEPISLQGRTNMNSGKYATIDNTWLIFIFFLD